MKKSKFMQSSIILVIGALITKVLGMIVKIIMTRYIGSEGMGLYMLLSPTFMLFIAIAQLGFPIAISTLVATKKKNNRSLILSLIPISLLINILLFTILYLLAPYLSTYMLKDPRLYYPIIAIGLVLPFVSISSIMRGYFLGKENVFPHVLSLIIEDIIWLIVLMIGIPYFLNKGIGETITFIVLSNVISELTSIIILFIFIPNKTSIKKEHFIVKDNNISDVLSVGLPATGSRLIGIIGYFFEPIIITTILLKVGYKNNFIINQYGIINGYISPLLLMPSFLTLAISQALIPVVSSHFANSNLKYIKYKVLQAIKYSLMIGIPATILFFFWPTLPLKLIYNTNIGIDYLKVMAPFYLILYIQYPLVSTLQAMNKAKVAMTGTLIGMVLRTILLIILSYLKIGLWGLVIASITNIVISTIYQGYKVRKILI